MSALTVVEGSAVEVGPRTLAANEAIIERGLGTFVEVGQALREIRDEDQYRESGYTRFEDYCTERWGFGRNYANKLVAAADTADAVGTDVPTIPSEAVARALPKDAKQAREVWTAAVEEHGPKPTAAAVAEVRDRIAPKAKQSKRPAKPDRPTAPKAKPARPTHLPKDAELWSDADVACAQEIVAGRAVAVIGTQVAGWLEKYDPSLTVWVDRGPWSNPFTAGEDGDPEEVVSLYAEHYLPFKAALSIADLRGKALRFAFADGADEHACYLAALANNKEFA